MAFSLNKATLIGNLGRDPETRFAGANNLAITTFSMATTRSYKGADGNWINETTWHNIKAFNLGDFYKDNLKKGSKIYVEGRIKHDEYTDKEGIKRYRTEIIAENIIPLDARERGESKSSFSAPESGGEEASSSAPEDDLPF